MMPAASTTCQFLTEVHRHARSNAYASAFSTVSNVRWSRTASLTRAERLTYIARELQIIRHDLAKLAASDRVAEVRTVDDLACAIAMPISLVFLRPIANLSRQASIVKGILACPECRDRVGLTGR